MVECSDPPVGEFISRKISFSHVPGQYWTETEVTYFCDASHSLKWGEPEKLTCGRDGNWSFDSAPRCAPSNFFFVNKNI